MDLVKCALFYLFFNVVLIFFCVQQKYECHTSLERHEREKIITMSQYLYMQLELMFPGTS